MLFDQAKAASKIVMGQGVLGTELHQALVYVKSLGESPLEREIVPLNAENIDVIRITFQNAGKEIQLEIKLIQVGWTGQGATGWPTSQ